MKNVYMVQVVFGDDTFGNITFFDNLDVAKIFIAKEFRRLLDKNAKKILGKPGYQEHPIYQDIIKSLQREDIQQSICVFNEYFDRYYNPTTDEYKKCKGETYMTVYINLQEHPIHICKTLQDAEKTRHRY